MSYDKVFHWTEISPVEVKKGFFRRILVEGEKLTMVISEVQPGSAGHPHHHPEEQVMFFLKGTCQDNDGRVYEPGTVTYVASGKTHGGLTSVGKESSIVIEVFAPPRKKDPLVEA